MKTLMDQSVGPRPVANGYTNARTNKLTLTHTQVKCFNSCQKTCKNPICLSFPSAEPQARRARHRAPTTPAGLRHGRAVKLSQGRGPGGGRTDSGTEGRRRRAAASQSGGGMRRGRAPCPLAANQSERSWSSRPWHIPPRRGGEEEHEPRRDAAG